jgi:hypothetical protein
VQQDAVDVVFSLQVVCVASEAFTK